MSESIFKSVTKCTTYVPQNQGYTFYFKIPCIDDNLIICNKYQFQFCITPLVLFHFVSKENKKGNDN